MPNHVFITGVSAGLGQALMHHYLQQNSQVWGCSRRQPAEGQQTGLHFREIDLADFESLPEQLTNWLGEPVECELAILNAGMLSPFGDMQQVSVAECQQVLDLNLWANKVILDWLLPRAPQLKQVVCISSGAGINGKRGWNAYAISKAALNMLVKLYAQEAPQAHFSALAPGCIETAMQEHLCNLPEDERFPTLGSLRQRRGTELMPTPDELAPRLAHVIEQARTRIPSGSYFDYRQLPWDQAE